MPWRREWQPTPVLLLRVPWTEGHGGPQSAGYSPRRLRVHEELDTTEQLAQVLVSCIYNIHYIQHPGQYLGCSGYVTVAVLKCLLNAPSRTDPRLQVTAPTTPGKATALPCALVSSPK